MIQLKVFSTLTILLALASGLPFSLDRQILLPNQDPFYQSPADYAYSGPGTIIGTRHRPSLFHNSPSSIQLLYRTTNFNGNPLSAVTTVFVPARPDPGKLLSVQEPADSADIDCPPSYTVQQPAGDFSNDTMIQMALDHGWYVNLPDYEGPFAAFGSGNQAGRAVLDSVRAALASSDVTGIDSDARVALQGYSGGAFASEWAWELQPHYAPDLAGDMVGAALGGLVPNWTHLYHSVNEQSYAAPLPSTIVGIAIRNADLRATMLDQLKREGPYNATGFLRARHECSYPSQALYGGTDVYAYFKDGGAWLDSEQWLDFVNEIATMGRRGPSQVPLYSYHAVMDQIAPVEDTDRLMRKYCGEGARIEYVRNATADHLSENPDGLRDAFAWLARRMEGVPIARGCNITTIEQ